MVNYPRPMRNHSSKRKGDSSVSSVLRSYSGDDSVSFFDGSVLKWARSKGSSQGSSQPPYAPRAHSQAPLSARIRGGASTWRIKINGVPALRSSPGPATCDFVLGLRHNNMQRSSLNRRAKGVFSRFPRCPRSLATNPCEPFPEQRNRDLGLTRIGVTIEHRESTARGFWKDAGKFFPMGRSATSVFLLPAFGVQNPGSRILKNNSKMRKY